MKRKDLDNSAGQYTDSSKQITVREAGRRGGHATLERRGIDFFREIGKRGGVRTKQLYAELLREFGRRGGRPKRPALPGRAGEKD